MEVRQQYILMDKQKDCWNIKYIFIGEFLSSKYTM